MLKKNKNNFKMKLICVIVVLSFAFILTIAQPIMRSSNDVGKQLDHIRQILKDSLNEEVPQERSQLSRKKRACSCGGCWIKGFRNNCCTEQGPYECKC